MDVSGCGIPDASAFPANGDSRGSARNRRRRRYQKIKAASSAMPTTPPTTAPAIFPALELFWFEPLLGAADAVDDVWTVEVPSGVDSGES